MYLVFAVAKRYNYYLFDSLTPVLVTTFVLRVITMIACELFQIPSGFNSISKVLYLENSPLVLSYLFSTETFIHICNITKYPTKYQGNKWGLMLSGCTSWMWRGTWKLGVIWLDGVEQHLVEGRWHYLFNTLSWSWAWRVGKVVRKWLGEKWWRKSLGCSSKA